jgi:hypothetical protein
MLGSLAISTSSPGQRALVACTPPLKVQVLHSGTRRRRDRKAALQLVKLSAINGTAVYARFEAWVDQVATITVMSFLVSGAAKEWYNKHGRDREGEWIFQKMTMALFDRVFPPKYSSIQRQTFKDAAQRENSLKDWYTYITKLAIRVPHIFEHDSSRGEQPTT